MHVKKSGDLTDCACGSSNCNSGKQNYVLKRTEQSNAQTPSTVSDAKTAKAAIPKSFMMHFVMADTCHLNNGRLSLICPNRRNFRSLLLVKMRRTRVEQMSSAILSTADVGSAERPRRQKSPKAIDGRSKSVASLARMGVQSGKARYRLGA